MLYTLSKASYDPQELQQLIQHINEHAALLLWQDGVLQAGRSAPIFAPVKNLFVLENDLIARGLTADFRTISLPELVKLTEQYHPHFAL